MKKFSAVGICLLLAGALLQVACAQSDPSRTDPSRTEQPRNVILFIADGMGVTALATVSTILEREGRSLVLEQMPVTGLLRTNALDHVVTESASSATSLATGFKTVRRRLSMDADSMRLPTIMEAARDAGFGTGLISSMELVDATPAAFAAHTLHRDYKDQVAAQLVASGVDVLIGGTAAAFTPDVLAAARANGYTVVDSGEALEGVAQTPVLALFPARPTHHDAFGPPLAVSTARALALLDQREAPFLLVIEQEETDHAGHDNDLPRVVAGVEELDAAVQRALAFAERRGDTLVLVTADHDTAGFSEIEKEEGVQWLTGGHTNQWVPLLADGPGALAFTGVHENTEVPRILARLLGLSAFLTPVDAGDL